MQRMSYISVSSLLLLGSKAPCYCHSVEIADLGIGLFLFALL